MAYNQENMTTTETLERAGRKVSEAASDVGHKVRDTVHDASQSVREAGQRVLETGRVAGRESWQTIERNIHDRPMSSLAIAAGVGIVIGLMLRR